MTQHRKRLIEVSLPIEAISAQSAREKYIRHGHISTLHIWWARRPLAAMRAAIFASLIPAPETDEEREYLHKLIGGTWDPEEDYERIAGTYHDCRGGNGYADEPGFCYSATLDEIADHNYVLTPGRYVSVPELEDDGEPFEEKMEPIDSDPHRAAGRSCPVE